MITNTTESRLQQNCYIWLHNTYPHLRGLFFRVKNEGHDRISGARGKATGIIPGVSDCILLLPFPARPVMIEFKTETGVQSPAQIDWQNKVEAAGYRYEIVRSLERFKSLVCTFI
jgi:hypothetical protein